MGLAICIIGIVFSAIYSIFRYGTEESGEPLIGLFFVVVAILIFVIPGGLIILLESAFGKTGEDIASFLLVCVGVAYIIWLIRSFVKDCKHNERERELRSRREMARTFLRSVYEGQFREEVNQMEPTHDDIESIALKHYVYCTYYRLSDAQKEEYTQEWREKKIQLKLQELYLKEIPNDEDVERVIAKYEWPSSSQEENL